MDPIDRYIEQLLDERTDRNMEESAAIFQAISARRWTGDDKVEGAKRLMERMKSESFWREVSAKKNPRKDKEHQRTLRVLAWLKG